MTDFEIFSLILISIVVLAAPLGLWLIERSGRRDQHKTPAE